VLSLLPACGADVAALALLRLLCRQKVSVEPLKEEAMQIAQA